MVFQTCVILGAELTLVLVTGEMKLLIPFLIGNTFFYSIK